MLSTTLAISINGKMQEVPAFPLDNVVIITNGAFLKVAEVVDEYWLPADSLPDPNRVIEYLQSIEPKPDLFTFAQRVPDTTPKYDFHRGWDNVAAIPVSSHHTWLREQVSAATRRNIRTSENKGVIVKAVEFDESFVNGIMSIFNESPIRHGRRYRHYGKDFQSVQAENGTYRERSTFLGAYLQDALIGYMKIVWDTRSAAIMQILSKLEFLDRRPNNALLSEAVRLCAQRGVPYLLYERFVYGNKGEDSLTKFKESNGFIRMDLPRYYVPLSWEGRLSLKLGLHQERPWIPRGLRNQLIELRRKWYARKSDGD